ncbi:4-hydroxy-4-methyl-2-oxoglutarate aldolase [Halopolyspora algeriensis]|uniref:Putative 4-hydroxy-4-methyl-2-oxoglutarate aldolase n=1 Tax=Halopolyspora algeriensis TaxID=1500506 RepID=A0A368VIC7_9ACTN|nr:4-carboxy-4-hydroxy-2-oxoadipate aldolase/oxaloacetate decarboxylase [Halopolyspora algeriensis]RCW40961.1 4-hydroxy-4-methyl-2-oxoglutarate aldolase [Halopolyspora algeriensis]TQM53955.1 4-hydroxy-4-methyl-2-oxoglutarate aldolase [Halopolyspora algeriensis]
MNNVIVTDPPRAELDKVTKLSEYGVATVHEALGRTGFLGSQLRPTHLGSRIGGTAVTVLCWPGDNLMIHAAIEQCRPGDVLVVTTTSPCTDGLFGELFATALQVREVRGLVTTSGVRDVDDLHAMGFPVWSAAVSAQGTVKATPGSVNVPITIGGQLVRPGDAILADDDGAMVVPRNDVDHGLQAAQARVDKEEATREAFRSGELGLDRYNLRTKLADLGVQYLTAQEYGL